MIQPPYGKPWLLYGILGCSLALNLVMVVERGDARDTAGAASSAGEAAPLAAVASVVPEQQPTAVAAAPATPPPAAAPAATTPVVAMAASAPVPTPLPAVVPAGWTVTQAEVQHSLARTFQKAVGDDGDALSAVYSRLFVWDLDLRRDLQRGDQVEVAWRRDDRGDVEVVAARLHSGKLGRTLAAYRWQAPGDAFVSYWSEDGTEVPFRLKDGPLQDYEQITSLLKDRPSHAGMDFKAPVGTPVTSPKAGTVTRVNWNWSSNGNCVEVKHTDGAVAKYLHLSEARVSVGQTVSPGDIIALTGNTGRSTAPHLHYQVEQGGKVVDPLTYHTTVRRRIEGANLGALLAETSRMDAILGQAVAQR